MPAGSTNTEARRESSPRLCRADVSGLTVVIHASSTTDFAIVILSDDVVPGSQKIFCSVNKKRANWLMVAH